MKIQTYYEANLYVGEKYRRERNGLKMSGAKTEFLEFRFNNTVGARPKDQ